MMHKAVCLAGIILRVLPVSTSVKRHILPNGKISGYGDQAIQTLQSMANNDGKFDEIKLLDHYCDYFGDPKSEYQIALTKRGNWKLSTAALPVEGIYYLFCMTL